MSRTSKLSRPRIRPAPQSTSPSRPNAAANPPLLVERAEGCRMLGGISVWTAIRMEKRGLLTPRRLFNSPRGRVYYSHDEVTALAAKGRNDDR